MKKKCTRVITPFQDRLDAWRQHLRAAYEAWNTAPLYAVSKDAQLKNIERQLPVAVWSPERVATALARLADCIDCGEVPKRSLNEAPLSMEQQRSRKARPMNNEACGGTFQKSEKFPRDVQCDKCGAWALCGQPGSVHEGRPGIHAKEVKVCR